VCRRKVGQQQQHRLMPPPRPSPPRAARNAKNNFKSLRPKHLLMTDFIFRFLIHDPD